MAKGGKTSASAGGKVKSSGTLKPVRGGKGHMFGQQTVKPSKKL